LWATYEDKEIDMKIEQKIRKLKAEIKQIKKKQRVQLNSLYDLGLAPFYGYYEMKLKMDMEKLK